MFPKVSREDSYGLFHDHKRSVLVGIQQNSQKRKNILTDRFIPKVISSEKYTIYLNESQKKTEVESDSVVDNYQEEQNQNTY